MNSYLETGARVPTSESSGGLRQAARKVPQKLGVMELARRIDVELSAFKDGAGNWIKVEIDGECLDTGTVSHPTY